MTTPITIRLANAKDFAPQPDFLELLELLEPTRPMAHRYEVLRVAGEQGISYAKAFEMVEDTLEKIVGRRRYGGYEVSRVTVCRIAKRERQKKALEAESKQLDLFNQIR